MNPIFRELEIHQMHIDRTHGPACTGTLRKVADGDGNFDYYYYPKYNYFMSIAKPESGCKDSVFGKKDHMKKMIFTGRINSHSITKYGRKVLGIV